MKDQNSIDATETSTQKYERALDLFTESVMKPDHDLRGCAHNQGCYEQLMEIREHVLEYLKTLKEVTHHTNADESDELETQKLIETKKVYTEKQYWEGKVPDDQFESYLNKYGYEYTPVPEIKLSQRARHSDLDAL
tara:strand:+ start:157 stop:564 length:408 start_codon:yes stop_codon:yes gene_type:complete